LSFANNTLPPFFVASVLKYCGIQWLVVQLVVDEQALPTANGSDGAGMGCVAMSASSDIIIRRRI